MTTEVYDLTDGEDCLYVAGIEEESVVDGPGIRFTIFLQGCEHHCPGCHNPETWNHDPDTLAQCEMSFDSIIDKISKNKIITGITLSGGDPILQHDKLIRFIDELRESKIELPIMLYTGYTLEQIEHLDIVKKRYVHDIMDGRFMEELKSLDVKFRGSTNQKWWTRLCWFGDWSPIPEDNGYHDEYVLHKDDDSYDFYARKPRETVVDKPCRTAFEYCTRTFVAVDYYNKLLPHANTSICTD